VSQLTLETPSKAWPAPAAVLELLKPVTWFAPMWAFMCGIVSSGAPVTETWPLIIAGAVLAGPLLCGTSQAVNDWFDRHVDAINEPGRPIPSGRIPGRWGLYVAIAWSALSLGFAAFLGPWVFWAAVAGLFLAWAYSMPPLRLKMSGWWGPSSVALCYEGLAWFTGAAVVLGAMPGWPIVMLAVLYSIGAHGIMTLNDFKAVEGDTKLGIRSLPVVYGVRGAAWIACIVMTVPQAVVIGLLIWWGHPAYAAGVAALLIAQIGFMARLMTDPKRFAPWYNATGVTSYVLGMLISAIAISPSMAGGAA
jgi:chlorophyll/bacteriochlorophyll a synthase